MLQTSAVILLLFLQTLRGAIAAPQSLELRANWFNTFWTDTAASVKYNNLPEGAYSVTWNGTGNFVGGKGWNPGSTSKILNWTGSFEPNGYAYLTVYGWTTNPLVEYYIVENYHTDHEPAAPPEGEVVANLTSDGSLYSVRTKMRVNKPSIIGTATFRQIFSVRQNTRSEGVVTVGNHFATWKEAGLKIGTQNYMVMATEGNNSSGKARIEVH
ncbi:glycoside hydrolase family 11 protein [Karstenula rhodostoma CBS 690.94]|uniref:Endo-1,4-beta-xylanase n=1 Tax=Karstenula rhodostoma CBS 690.94 TaxID=1392251 RepID=A0A9P4PWY8_9PLEO|nr:glycoside hydrolase family 11 protein [Karstenula rhodostoma CBS 690.94]